MPFLVVNMGGEMVYILEQRLQAQAVSAEKSRKVISDVVQSMFNAKFIQELFRPQELYSSGSTRGIFDRLAHSSIMRLSESSMDKLYDLMTMGFKYQLVSCSFPQELIGVTLNHLDAIRGMLGDDQAVLGLLDMCIAQFKTKFDSFSMGEMNEVRQTLLRFFQDRRIKVSLFLQENLQTPSGAIIFPPEEEAPPGVCVPGTIKYFNEAGAETRATSFPYHGTAKPASNPPPRTKLGINLYLKKRSNQSSPMPFFASSTPAPKTSSATSSPVITPSAPPPTIVIPPTPTPSATSGLVYPSSPSDDPTNSGKAGLNLLAQLIGPGTQAAGDKEQLKVNLFAADLWGGSNTASNFDAEPINVITLDVTRQTDERTAGLVKNFGLQESQPDEDGDDLLDLMDKASK